MPRHHVHLSGDPAYCNRRISQICRAIFGRNAAGYSACFLGALGLVARNAGVRLGEHALDAEVGLIKDDTSFHIAVTLTLSAPELDRATAEDLLRKAHAVCPYSKATRGNVEVTLKVA